MHSHFIPSEYMASLKKENRLLDEGFPLPKYDVKNHIKWMDEAGIEKSVLTLPAPQPKVLTQSIEQLRQYLSSESDFAPYQKKVLSENARLLFGK